MAVRLTEAEEAAEQARNKAAKLEKDRNKLQLDIKDLIADFNDVIISILKASLFRALRIAILACCYKLAT